MKKIFLLMTIMFLMVFSIPASAYDFSAVNDDGVTIYYTLISTKDLTVEVSYGDESYAGDVNIPATFTCEGKEFTVTAIGDYAFYWCHYLTSVTLPNTVTSIGYGAFNQCYRLTSVDIPDSVTSIGNVAFSDCSGLTSVTIPESVTYLGEYAFAGCSSLTSVTIPNSITSIEYFTFSSCSSLTSVIIPDSVISIGNGAFTDCSSLNSVIIGNSVKFINYSAFNGCSGLTSVTIPDSVIVIENYAFNCCTGLITVAFGENLEKIGEGAFYGCNNIRDLWSMNPVPPSCSIDAFMPATYVFATLHVPEGATAAYQAAEVWKEFGTICEDKALISVTLNPTCLTLSVDESATLTATIIGGVNEDSKVTWTSDNTSVATVDDEGLVTAISKGTATITATCGESSATCTVTVIEKCAAPSLSVNDDYAIVAESETPDAQIHITVNCDDAGTYDCTNGQALDLTGVYTVTAYATAEGYSDSEVVTAILVWTKAYDNNMGADIVEMNTDRAILLIAVDDKIAVKGCAANEPVAVYDIAGNQLYAGEAAADYFVIPVSLAKGNIYLVTIGGRTIKYLF